MKPDDAEAYNGLANIYNAQRKFDQAAAASAKANELTAPRARRPARAATPTRCTTRASSSGTPARLPTRRRRSSRRSPPTPNHAEAHYQLGMALVNEGKLAEAATEFEHVSEARARRPERRDRQGARRTAAEVVLDSAALRARLADVRDRIARAAGRAGRDPASHPPHRRLQDLLRRLTCAPPRDAGQVDFGENKVQEAQQKMRRDRRSPAALASHRPPAIEQGRESRRPLRRDSLDRQRRPLVRKIDAAAAAAGRALELLVQVDLAGEATKHGAREADLPAIFEAARGCTAVTARRAMLLPPAVDDSESARPWFRELRPLSRSPAGIRHRARHAWPSCRWA